MTPSPCEKTRKHTRAQGSTSPQVSWRGRVGSAYQQPERHHHKRPARPPSRRCFSSDERCGRRTFAGGQIGLSQVTGGSQSFVWGTTGNIMQSNQNLNQHHAQPRHQIALFAKSARARMHGLTWTPPVFSIGVRTFWQDRARRRARGRGPGPRRARLARRLSIAMAGYVRLRA